MIVKIYDVNAWATLFDDVVEINEVGQEVALAGEHIFIENMTGEPITATEVAAKKKGEPGWRFLVFRRKSNPDILLHTQFAVYVMSDSGQTVDRF